MITKIMKPLKTILLFSLAMFLLCGLVYPLAMTGIAQIVFPKQANGSIISIDGKEIGSQLIGQDFTDERFMKCRPSAVNYNTYTEAQKAAGEYGGVATGSKNYAPSNPDLAARVEQSVSDFLAANPTVSRGEIPADLLTASGSGLDPHVSPESAEIQLPALVKTTGLSEETLMNIVKNNTTPKLLGVFGEPIVNVLGVNLEIAKELNLL